MKFSIVLIVVLLAVGIPATYYFAVALPKAGNEQFLSEQKIKCKEAGEEQYQRELANQKSTKLLFTPKFHFNKRLNTCLYRNGWSMLIEDSNGKYGTYSEQYILDLYTNKTIASYQASPDGLVLGSMNIVQFGEEENRLFSE
jgi:hypothetical protein